MASLEHCRTSRKGQRWIRTGDLGAALRPRPDQQGILTSGGKERMMRTTTGMTPDHLYEVMVSLCGSNFSTIVSR